MAAEISRHEHIVQALDDRDPQHLAGQLLGLAPPFKDEPTRTAALVEAVVDGIAELSSAPTDDAVRRKLRRFAKNAKPVEAAAKPEDDGPRPVATPEPDWHREERLKREAAAGGQARTNRVDARQLAKGIGTS